MGGERRNDSSLTPWDRQMKHGMRQIVFVLVAVAALAGVVAYTAPASGQADAEAAPISRVTIPPDTATGG